jgi:ATP-dependent helicase YprA (DUF1998 family)
MLHYLIPKDEVDNESNYHNTIRTQTERPIQAADDREYSLEEIRLAIEAINSKKAPGEDGITSEILQRAYKQIPNLIYTSYNQCLSQACLPTILKRIKVIPITKPGKEDTTDPSKYRPISLIKVGGKVLEKLLTESCITYIQTIS